MDHLATKGKPELKSFPGSGAAWGNEKKSAKQMVPLWHLYLLGVIMQSSGSAS